LIGKWLTANHVFQFRASQNMNSAKRFSFKKTKMIIVFVKPLRLVLV